MIPTFTTRDVLPSGQTGWDLTLAGRLSARWSYRMLRRLDYTRDSARLRVCHYLDSRTTFL